MVRAVVIKNKRSQILFNFALPRRITVEVCPLRGTIAPVSSLKAQIIDVMPLRGIIQDIITPMVSLKARIIEITPLRGIVKVTHLRGIIREC